MRSVLYTATVILAAWLQIAGLGTLKPLGIVPNVMLVVVTLFALRLNASQALAAAVLGGWLLDAAAGGSAFGLHIAFYVVLALGIIAGRQLGVQVGASITGLVIVAVGTVVYNLAVLATLATRVPLAVISSIGRELCVNLALVAIFYIVRANLDRQTRGGLEVTSGFGR